MAKVSVFILSTVFANTKKCGTAFSAATAATATTEEDADKPKCTTKFVDHGTAAGEGKKACGASKKVSTTLKCAKADCGNDDEATCCVTTPSTSAKAKCKTMFVNFGGSATGGKVACETDGQVVKAETDCDASPCKGSDKSACCALPPACNTKWELSTGSTAGKEQCPGNKVLAGDDVKCKTFACDDTTADQPVCCVAAGRQLSSKTPCPTSTTLKAEKTCASTTCKKEECCVSATAPAVTTASATTTKKKSSSVSGGFVGCVVFLL